jgi:hypothetical protein
MEKEIIFELPKEKMEAILNNLMEAPAKYSYYTIVQLTTLKLKDETPKEDSVDSAK